MRVIDLIVTQGVHVFQARRTTYLKGPDGVWDAQDRLERSGIRMETRMDYRNAAGNEFDIEMVIKLACSMVQNAGRLWYKLQTVENRQMLQRALFPEGQVYDQENRFGTSVSTWPIRVFSGNIDPVSQVAPPRGLGRTFLRGLAAISKSIRCERSTTWSRDR